MTDHADGPRRGGGRWIFLPTLLLLLLAGAWSGFWWWAAGETGATIDAWLAREAQRGRVYACGDRRIGGYPFRIEVECRDVAARLPVESGILTATAPRLVALAQVYDPKQVIAELGGPVSVQGPDGAGGELSFAEARGSVRAEGRRIERGSLALRAPRLVSGETELSAAAFEAHLRRAPDAPAGTYDLAASLDGAASPLFDLLPLGAGPVTAELQLRASGLDDVRPGPVSERLRAFAEAGGTLEVTLAKLTRGDVAAQAKGEVRLDLEGRAEGDLRITARGVDEVMQSLFAPEAGGDVSSLLGLGAKMLGKKAELDGRPATTYRLKLDKGRVNLGPIRLTRLPPAF